MGSVRQANSFSTRSTTREQPSLLAGPPALFSKSPPSSRLSSLHVTAAQTLAVESPDQLLTPGCLHVSSTWLGGMDAVSVPADITVSGLCGARCRCLNC